MASFTEEQSGAIFTQDKNLIVVAGAGSGKTRVLVERYLTLLEMHPDWQLNAIVAITFTREAALEMRNRVRQEIEQRLHAADSARMMNRWADLLSQMDSARIDTIHSLCASILRANAAEADIDPGFALLEPVDAQVLLADVIQRQLDSLVGDEADDTAVLLTEYDLRDLKATFTNAALINASFKNIPSEPASLISDWQRDWIRVYQDVQESLKNEDYFNDLMAWEPVDGWPQEDDIIFSIFQQIHNYREELLVGSVDVSYDACKVILQAIKLRGGKASAWGSKDTLEEAKSVLKSLRERLQAFLSYVSNPPGAIDEAAAFLLIRWYRLVLRIRHAYQNAKIEEGYLDFNDLESKTAKLLWENESVRARYQGEEYKRILVDEFQDTNDDQWNIITSLVNLDNDTALFVVGDQKQSIYGFRGADVTVFDRVRRKIAHMPHGEDLSLSQSFRSHPGLIEGFNKLFSHILQRDENSPVAEYEIEHDRDMIAHRDLLPPQAANLYGSLELLLLRNRQSHLEDKINSGDRRIWEANEIAQRLHQLKDQSAPILDRETGEYRPFDYGDVAILFQSTRHITVYENVFKAVGLPFVTVAGRGYYNRQEVWDMVNLIRSLHNPGDHVSLASVLRSPIFGFSDDLLLALSRLRRTARKDHRLLSLWDTLAVEKIAGLDEQQMELIRSAYRILSALRQIAGKVTVSELLRQALSLTGYLVILTGLPNGARLRRNVEKLIDIAESSGKITLGDFSQYLIHLTEREVREGEAVLDTAHAVRLMTVHASKGLEFPIVILPDAGWVRGGNQSDYLVLDTAGQRLACVVYDDEQRKYVPSYLYQRIKQLQTLREDAERKRLLYVAATRARDCLMIGGELSETQRGWTVRGWLQEILEGLEIENLDDLKDGIAYEYTAHTTVRFHLPEYDADLPKSLRSEAVLPEWKPLRVQTDMRTPQRLQPVEVRLEDMVDHITATRLADLGGYRYSQDANDKEYYRNTLWRYILDDTNAKIPNAIRNPNSHVRSADIGEIVHNALRYWRFPDNTPDLDRILRGYAWQKGISDRQDLELVLNQAKTLLSQFQESDIYQRMNTVREKGLPFYSELPFLYRTEKRIIHGIIDVLLQTESGEWILLDYKTSSIKNPTRENLQDHAQRFHLQVGAYAAAVQQELGGVTPGVFIHYIQYNQTILIPTDTWQDEIQQLEDYIGDVTHAY